MKRIIITGATSFIGTHLIKKLLKDSWEIYAVVRRNSKKRNMLPKDTNIHIVELDMEEYSKLPELIDVCCDVFVTLAWNGTRGSERSDAAMQEQNYIYSMSALNAAVEIGCRTVISAGSQAEYGLMTKKTAENAECNPNTEYGKWKLKFYEDALKKCRACGVSFKEPRFFSLYGEDDSERTMIISILDAMMKNKPCHLTEGIQIWNFLHIDDAVEGIIKLAKIKCADGAYNFGSEDTRMLQDFIMEMKEISHSTSELFFGVVPYPASGVVNVWPDVTKLKRETGWRPCISFKDGISRIIQYRLRNERI